MTLADLPAIHAALNASVTVLLVVGRQFIRRGQEPAHRRCMAGAVLLSAVFLGSYLYYHFRMQQLHGQAHTSFRDPAWFRPIYLALLGTHLLGAIVNLPMIVATVLYAARGEYPRHRRLARLTWPLWLYVSVTGVLVYLLLYRLFPQAAGQ